MLMNSKNNKYNNYNFYFVIYYKSNNFIYIKINLLYNFII